MVGTGSAAMFPEPDSAGGCPRMAKSHSSGTRCTLLQSGFKCKHKATYASLIAMAIHAAPGKRLMLHQIYAFVDAHRSLVPAAVHPNWKNSVRHNLSLRSCFKKIPRWAPGGKKLSAFWELDMAALPPAAEAAIAELNAHGPIQFPFPQAYADEAGCRSGEEGAVEIVEGAIDIGQQMQTPCGRMMHHPSYAALASRPGAMYHKSLRVPQRLWQHTPECSDREADDVGDDEHASMYHMQRSHSKMAMGSRAYEVAPGGATGGAWQRPLMAPMMPASAAMLPNAVAMAAAAPVPMYVRPHMVPASVAYSGCPVMIPPVPQHVVQPHYVALPSAVDARQMYTPPRSPSAERKYVVNGAKQSQRRSATQKRDQTKARKTAGAKQSAKPVKSTKKKGSTSLSGINLLAYAALNWKNTA